MNKKIGAILIGFSLITAPVMQTHPYGAVIEACAKAQAGGTSIGLVFGGLLGFCATKIIPLPHVLERPIRNHYTSVLNNSRMRNLEEGKIEQEMQRDANDRVKLVQAKLYGASGAVAGAFLCYKLMPYFLGQECPFS